jgi:hypothetical protein
MVESMAVQLERRADMSLPIRQEGQQPADRSHLLACLQDPQRLLAQLLSSELIEPLGADLFRYVPRPLDLPSGLRLAPEVQLKAQWLDPLLHIELIQYQLPGLAGLEQRIHYRFKATMGAAPGRLLLQAHAELTLNGGEQGLRLPEPVLRILAGAALRMIFGRIERRCRRNLPRLLRGQTA